MGIDDSDLDTDDEKPHVHLLATGGTIANPPDVDGYISGEKLVQNVPEVADIASVTVDDVASIASTCISPKVWYELHRRITDLSNGASRPDGIVVTHGSNTLEETAYFLHLTANTSVPIVLTAAQRNHRTPGNDGDRNLIDAVRVAAHPESRGRGALVVVNDEIHSARDVTKSVSGRPDAWTSGNLGVLGLTDKRGRVRFYRENPRPHTVDTEFEIDGQEYTDFPRVEILYSAAGTDGTLARLATESGLVDGIVVAALPTGAPSRPVGYEDQSEALAEAVGEGIPVVLCHRGLEGWPYRYEPFVRGDVLRPQKARILLALGLQRTTDHRELQDMFTKY